MDNDWNRFMLSDIQERQTKDYPEVINEGCTDELFCIWYVDAPLSFTKEYFCEPDDDVVGGDIWLYVSMDGKKVFYGEIIQYFENENDAGETGDFCYLDDSDAEKIFALLDSAKYTKGVFYGCKS